MNLNVLRDGRARPNPSTEGITVITPCLNPGPYLLPCLESLAAQGEIVSRHIVMDGGSIDGTQGLLAEFAREHPRFLWASAKDEGQSDALNKALALVETGFFGWLNADDLYLPGALGSLLSVAREASVEPAIVYGDYTVVDEAGKTVRFRRQPSFAYWDCLYGYLTVQNCAAIFNTRLVRESGGFDRALRFAMDYDLILRLATGRPVHHVRRYAGSFRLHPESKTARLGAVCREETLSIRRKYSGQGSFALTWRASAAKVRVFLRMLREGCLPCRLGLQGDEER